MVDCPFFSIVIPTKNRSLTIGNTLTSVLSQTFSDFELVIIDNSDDENTYLLLENFSDSRIRYVRTGGLPMTDNWERAYEEAKGKYLILISDRLEFIYHNTFEEFKKILTVFPSTVLTYGWTAKDQGDLRTKSLDYVNHTSKEIIQSFMDGGDKRHWFNIRSPKGLNTVLPADIYRKIKAKFGRICIPLAPDFCMSFILLSEIENLNFIQSNLLYSRNLEVSNGLQSKKNKEIFRNYLSSINYSDEDSFKFTLIPVAGVFNCMYNDFFHLNSKYKWGYSWKMVNLVEYFLLIIEEIVQNEFIPERESDLNKWKTSLDLQEKDVKLEVLKRIEHNSNKVVKTASWLQRLKDRFKKTFN